MYRVGIYYRVSTEEEKQLQSFQAQENQLTEFVQKQEDWELYALYGDKGISGTEATKRKSYNSLNLDIADKKLDIVLVKDVTRMGRNVLDGLLFLKNCYDNNVKVYLFLDKKFHDFENDLETNIKMIVAQQQSKDLSKNIRNSQKTRQNAGRPLTNGRTWGFKQIHGSAKLEILEDEAEIVRYIFKRYTEGVGFRTIEREVKYMLSDEIKERRNIESVPMTSLKRIIRQHLYKGVQVFNKQTKNFINKKMIQNPPEQWIYKKVCEPIVSDELWEEANRILDGKRKEINANEKSKLAGYWNGSYPLSSKIFCSKCGKVYYVNTNYSKTIPVAWQCSTYRNENKKVCDAVTVPDSEIMFAVKEVLFKYLNEKDEALDLVIKILKESLEEPEKNSKDISELEKKVKKLDNRLVNYVNMRADGELSKEQFLEYKTSVETEIEFLNKQIKEFYNQNQETLNKIERLNKIRNQLEKQFENSESIDEDTIKMLVNRINVHGDRKNKSYEIILNTGFSQNVQVCPQRSRMGPEILCL